MRKKIVAGNWKMNNNAEQTESLLDEIIKKNTNTETQIIVAPSFVNLALAVEKLRETNIKVSAQNVHQSTNGAYTGEVSVPMLKSIGVNTVILGHSERRTLFGENNSILAQKISTAIKYDFEVIYCFGEELAQRKNDNHFEVVKTQLTEVLFDLKPEQWNKIILAYEPVWAIGTGETATPKQAQEIHAFARQIIAEKYTSEIANNIPILYGGSVKSDNAKEIFANRDVDGGLIGGASLIADDFLTIVNSFY